MNQIGDILDFADDTIYHQENTSTELKEILESDFSLIRS